MSEPIPLNLVRLRRSCAECSLQQLCLPAGVDGEDMGRLDMMVQRRRPLAKGESLFRVGDPLRAVYVASEGSFKTVVVNASGEEHVLGFHLPGEVIGLNAIAGERYPCNAVALDTVTLCKFSFPKISMLAGRLPRLQQTLFQLLSRDIGTASLLAGDWSADERMAAFLVRFSRRLAARGFSADRFQLTMSRTDIANYLRLAPETVSRVLKRFNDEGMIQVERREIELRDRGRLEDIAGAILHQP